MATPVQDKTHGYCMQGASTHSTCSSASSLGASSLTTTRRWRCGIVCHCLCVSFVLCCGCIHARHIRYSFLQEDGGAASYHCLCLYCALLSGLSGTSVALYCKKMGLRHCVIACVSQLRLVEWILSGTSVTLFNKNMEVQNRVIACVSL